MNSKWIHLASVAIVFMIVASLSLVRDHRLLGKELGVKENAEKVMTSLPDGSVVVNTSSLCKEVTGYAGPVPLEITVSNGVIDSVHALENSETPGFFRKVVEGGLLQHWNGVSVDSAAVMAVDGVTGATYSSNAVIENVRAGASYLAAQDLEYADGSKGWSIASVAALIVALMAAVVPLRHKGGKYRMIQELLNVAVLGFWTGTFVNYTMMLNFMSNGIHSFAAITAVVMLIVAFIYPLFGHDGYYCAWVCPLGSLQDLAGKCSRVKVHTGKRWLNLLTWARRVLWGALIVCMWLGVWMSWIDYELFSAFVVESAPVGMLMAGVAVVLLSVFVPRPYCRFVCPTGTLLRMSQNIESPNV